MNPLVTAGAQTLQIAFVMSAPLCQWLDVMHQLGLGEPTLTLASLAQWVATDIAVPNPAPSLIVTLVVVVATGEVVIVSLHHLPMVFAVTTLVVGQFGAAAVSAGSLWFHGHGVHLNSGQ